MNLNNAERASVLVEALPHIQNYTGKVVVIKYGGNAMINDDLKLQVMEDIALLHQIGVHVVLVHGGGPDISNMLKRVGKESIFKDGLRVTDKETMEIVQMVLAGKTNKSLVTLLEVKGAKAIGISGMDGQLIKAVMNNPDLGYVGRITQVNVQPILDLIEKGYIPVVSTIGCDDDGNVYNINADTAAARIAGAMQAERLITMTDIAGILANKDDPDSVIPCIDIEEAKQLFTDGIISGGMIPKVECCIEAIIEGVERVTILDGRIPHALLMETLTDEGAGTMVVKEK